LFIARNNYLIIILQDDENHAMFAFYIVNLRYVLKNIQMSIKKKYNIRFRIWFYANEDKFLGKGRVELLERIKETGSITNAAKGMKMSYRQAWQMVNEMNESAPKIVVEKSLGGKPPVFEVDALFPSSAVHRR